MAAPPRRYPTLDLLRLVAIGLTLLAHTPTLVERLFFTRPFAHALWLGVDLFMLISGWLLGGQLLRDAARSPMDPVRFYVKRWMRTLPPYYAMLFVLYFSHGPQFSGPLPSREILLHLTFLQQYFPPNDYMVSWSLCVEEHFYLLLPAFVWLLLRVPKMSAAIALVVGIELLSAVCRIATYTKLTDIPYLTHLRCHGLFLGLLLSWINLHRPDIWQWLGRKATWLGVAGIPATLLVMASVPSPPSRWMYIGAPLVGTWALALVFLASVHEGSAWSRVTFRGLRYMGELTYGMYLVHDVLPRAWVGGHAGAGGLRAVVVRLALVLGLSALLHHVVERPALLLRERLLRAWRPAGAPADAAPGVAR